MVKRGRTNAAESVSYGMGRRRIIASFLTDRRDIDSTSRHRANIGGALGQRPRICECPRREFIRRSWHPVAGDPDRLPSVSAPLSRNPHRPVARVENDLRRAGTATHHRRPKRERGRGGTARHRSDHTVDDQRGITRNTNRLASPEHHGRNEDSGHDGDHDPDRHHDRSVRRHLRAPS